MLYFAYNPVRLPEAPYGFTVSQGSSLRGVARQLTQEGVLQEPWSFVFLVRLFGKAGDIKAGNYQLEPGITPLKIFRMFTRGDVTQSQVVFIEGWTFRQMRAALDALPSVRHDSRNMTEQEILQAIGAREPSAEGLFLPETYYFSDGMSDLTILKRAYELMQQRLAEAWKSRQPGLPLGTPYEAVILASIVEKETARTEERARIAAVFINRLRMGMKLQTDPTVIYGMGESFDGNLRKQDLLTDTAYNTYTRKGLPPTPIAIPGWASIQAVLNPDDSGALYFVAKGNGTHHFSVTLEEHNRAVWRYQK